MRIFKWQWYCGGESAVGQTEEGPHHALRDALNSLNAAMAEKRINTDELTEFSVFQESVDPADFDESKSVDSGRH